MAQTSIATRVAGTWLAIASLLMVVVFVFHGPIAPDLNEQMQRIAEGATRWSVVHWIAAVALSLYAVSALAVLNAGSRLTQRWWTLTAWSVLPVAALWTVTTAVTEATVVAEAAMSGATETFKAWWAFGEGNANGFAIFVIAIAAIAGNEARSAVPLTPSWSAWLTLGASLASFVGWVLGMWFGVRAGSVLWVAASTVMSLWILWFGIALARSAASMEPPLAMDGVEGGAPLRQGRA
jgi:hypothetical protein